MLKKFSYTLDEYAEAINFQQVSVPMGRQKASLHFLSPLLMGLAAAAYAIGEERWGLTAHPGTPPDPLWNQVILPFGMMVLVLIAIAVPVFTTPMPEQMKPWDRPVRRDGIAVRRRRFFNSYLANIILTAVGILLFLSGHYERDPLTGKYEVRSVPVADVAVVVIVIGIYGLWQTAVGRAGQRRSRAWLLSAQDERDRDLEMEFNSDSIVVKSVGFASTYSWDYFPGFVETNNLFLIYLAVTKFWIIPKRVFSAEPELACFRLMLSRLKRTKTGGFPVMLAAQQPAGGFPVILPGERADGIPLASMAKDSEVEPSI